MVEASPKSKSREALTAICAGTSRVPATSTRVKLTYHHAHLRLRLRLSLYRCTGYRPILDALKTFASSKYGEEDTGVDTPPNFKDDAGFACLKGSECCQVKKDKSRIHVCDASSSEPLPISSLALARQRVRPLFSQRAESQEAPLLPYSAASEPIFPAWLAKSSTSDETSRSFWERQDLAFVDVSHQSQSLEDTDDDQGLEEPEMSAVHVRRPANGIIWLRPGSISSLVAMMWFYHGIGAATKLRSGDSECRIEVKFMKRQYAVNIFLGRIASLASFSQTEKGLAIGANLPLSDVIANLQRSLANMPDKQSFSYQVCRAIVSNAAHFASMQIRNTATLGGNIATASPISDLNLVWLALNADIHYVDATSVTSAQGSSHANSDSIDVYSEKSIAADALFVGYRKIALPSAAIITRVCMSSKPLKLHRRHFVRAYKQAKRKDDDIAIVTCCLYAEAHGDGSGQWQMRNVRLAYGGMAPTTACAVAAQEALNAKALTSQGHQELLQTALSAMSSQDFDLKFGVPGGMAVYRKSLALGFLAKFFGEIVTELGIASPENETWLQGLASLATSDVERPVTRASQDYEKVDVKVKGGSGEAMPHLSALKQCTGEAEYIDDIPPLADELAGALVLTTRANARIVRIDATLALQRNGGPATHFVGLDDLRKVGGNNVWCPPAFDDRFFVDDMSEAVGLVIGVVLAATRREAQRATSMVVVEYESLGDPILNIDTAISQESFLAARPKIVSNGFSDYDFDNAEAWSVCNHVLESKFRMGGQEHFYLETNAVAIIPGREDDEMEVWASTQNPTETQNFVASVLNCPANRITVRLKRLGGGFGGKESRSVVLAATMALACKVSGKPVRCMLDRDEDIAISGQRHPFKGTYKIGFNSDGKLVKLDAKIYSNAGWSQDLSRAVLERAMTHIDGCYRWPGGVRVRGWMCKTNTVSNTAFRGFGGPQGMMIIEDAIDKAARSIGLAPEMMRAISLNQEGDSTHYGQPILDWNVPTMWGQLLESADFAQRRRFVDDFNMRNRWKKRGLTMAGTRFGISFTFKTLNQARCLVHIYAHDGSVMLSHGGTEMGQGLHTKVVQIAASELGIPASKVHVSQTSTREAANTSPTAASAGSDLNGAATKDACDQLNERLGPYLRKPGVTWEQAVHSAYIDRVNLSAVGNYKTPLKGMDWETGKGEPFAYWTQGVVCAEAEVDVLTGDSRIVRADVTLDLARSINPGIDIGQIEGAFTQGFGLVTTEESLWKHDGQMTTKGPGNYKIPSEYTGQALFAAQ